jgi:PAS domain S-box-containing protein
VEEGKVIDSKPMLQAVLDASLHAIALHKTIRNDQNEIIDFQYVLTNAIHKKWTGRDLAGQNYLEVYPGVKAAGIFDAYKNVVETGEPLTMEVFYEGDGFKNWFRISAVKLGDDLVSTAEDITSRKAAEQEIKDTNKLLHGVLNAPNIGINVFKSIRDESGQIVDFEFLLVSKKAAEYQKRNDLVGKRLFEEYPVTKEHLQDLRKVVETGISHSYEFFYPSYDHWISVSYARFNDGLICVWENITELRNAVEELKQSRHFLNQLSNTTPNVIYVINLEPLKFLYVNKKLVDFLSYGEQQILDLGFAFFRKVLHPDDYQRRLRYLKNLKTLQPDEVRQLEYRILTSDGSYRWFKSRDKVFKQENGKVLEIIGISEDITATKAAEAKLQELEENQQKEILNAVLGAQEEERRRIAETLHNDIGQLLVLAKMKLRDDSSRSEEILNDTIQQIRGISFNLMPSILLDFGLETALLDMIQTKLDDVGISYSSTITGLKRRLAPSLEIAVFRVVQELLNNIIKHSKADFTTVKVIREKECIRIEIRDNGIGIKVNGKAPAYGFGLNQITTRLKVLKGKLNIQRGKEKGTMIFIEIPVSKT